MCALTHRTEEPVSLFRVRHRHGDGVCGMSMVAANNRFMRKKHKIYTLALCFVFVSVFVFPAGFAFSFNSRNSGARLGHHILDYGDQLT